jgi:hypothetical protein
MKRRNTIIINVNKQYYVNSYFNELQSYYMRYNLAIYYTVSEIGLILVSLKFEAEDKNRFCTFKNVTFCNLFLFERVMSL